MANLSNRKAEREGDVLMFKVIVPTLNASRHWEQFAPALLECVLPGQVLVVDSESNDSTVELAREAGFTVVSRPRAEFNHGATRQMAAELCPEAEILVYMTQDTVLADSGSIASLLAAFADPAIGGAYGRQLPRPEARAIEAHARIFNYPAESQTRTLANRREFGIRVAFFSNSLAAYRRSTLMEIGGFPSDVIFGEDMVTAARMLLAGKKVAYVAEARAYHSHAYSWRQEFERSFDIGALHSREQWLLKEFGRATGEGARFVISEFRYILQREPSLLPAMIVRTAMKILGYRLGYMESRLSLEIKRRFSMHPGYWK